ncbi:MAG: DUF4256 domain-containing protein [Bacillota bacterium]|nr:DUF4256 domain-containing protein [Bacillota bacterium]
MSNEKLLEILKERFETHMERHRKLSWDQVLEYFEKDPSLLAKVQAMEDSAGQPDVFVLDQNIYFIDSAKESPEGRRSLCYDQEAREKRKNRPALSSVEEACKAMGVELVDEKMYLALQALADFDLKTTSWLKTDPAFRAQGGAIFANKHYGRSFVYYNQADAYYSSRGFRTFVKIK